MVTEEYSSTEEVEYPVKREIPSLKKVMAPNNNKDGAPAGKTGPKAQSSLASFFGKK